MSRSSGKRIAIIYDLFDGDTIKVARIIADAIDYVGDVSIYSAEDTDYDDLKHIDMLIVGSPTHRGRPSLSIAYFIDTIANHNLKDVQVAAYSVRSMQASKGRLSHSVQEWLSSLSAGRIIKSLKLKGGISSLDPLAIHIDAESETLSENERLRVVEWANRIEDVFLRKQKAVKRRQGTYAAS